MRLDGEVALITGSTKGIGRGIAEMFAAEGAKVVITGRTETAGQEVEAAIRGRGGEATFVRTDVSQEAEVEAAMETAAEIYGPLTVLVNNAAPIEDVFKPNSWDSSVIDLVTENYYKLMDTMLTSMLWSCKYAIPQMMDAGHGSIINISSASAVRASHKIVGYTAAKGAMVSLTRQMAFDYGHLNIRSNCLIAGFIVSGAQVESMLKDERYAAGMKRALMVRPGNVDDIGYACVYLASPKEAGFVTASTIAIDGGMTAAPSNISTGEVDHEMAQAPANNTLRAN